MKDDCLFCKIAKGDIPSATIYEDRYFRVFLDVNPASKGHCLIVPRELFALATGVARALRKALSCDGLNLVQNNGKVAGQTVNHFHLHLIPRYEGDQLGLLWKAKHLKEEEMEELRKKIKNAI